MIQTLKRLRVLYVDDDPMNTRVLYRTLQAITVGYTVTSKESASLALQFVKERIADEFDGAWFIVTDKDMPHADEGLALARELRELLGEKAYIILLTGDSTFKRTENDGLDHGAIRGIDALGDLAEHFQKFLKRI